MTEEEFAQLLAKMESNELYQKSSSVHKGFQFRQFFDSAKKTLMEGQQVRQEDSKGRIPEEEGFDETTARIVIYNFKNGVLHSENGEPAVQYPGHWEMWNQGLIEKVVSDGGDTEEYWENGIPVRIETNLAERRNKK